MAIVHTATCELGGLGSVQQAGGAQMEEQGGQPGAQEQGGQPGAQEVQEEQGRREEQEKGNMQGDKEKKKSLLRRLISALSLKRKKKGGKAERGAVEVPVEVPPSIEVSPPQQEEEVPVVEVEVTLLPEVTPVHSRPPLPGGARPLPHPSSATTAHSRPLTDLDSALKQFRLSTAASRENLRTLGSSRDLSLVGKVARRPPLARPGQGVQGPARERGRSLSRQPSFKKEAPPARDGLEEQWKQLSSSMSCLNRREEERAEVTAV